MTTLSYARTILSLALLSLAIACVNTEVQTGSEVPHPAIPKPRVVMVYNFAVTPKEARQLGAWSPSVQGEVHEGNLSQDDIDLGHEAADALADELVRELRGVGINAIRAAIHEPRPAGSMAVAGYFVDIEQGSHFGRLAIGFGVGRSSVDATVHLLALERKGVRDLLSFGVHSDSGRFPGAVVLGPAGLAAGAAVGGVIASESAIGAVKTYRAALSHQASQLASEIAAVLSRYFVEQGWMERR